MRRQIPSVGPEPDEPKGPLLERILIGRRKAAYVAGALVWLAALTFLWAWWLSPDHVVGWTSFVAVSGVLAWSTLLPVYCVIVFYRCVRPVGPLRIPSGARVAMVVTKAPSEPFAVVAETLKCMLQQDYPHDTWLADEDPEAETLGWCKNHRVQVSSRKGREDYHRPTWPRRTRCKEGNLAFFYDHFGYDDYDFVCQLDADHARALDISAKCSVHSRIRGLATCPLPVFATRTLQQAGPPVGDFMLRLPSMALCKPGMRRAGRLYASDLTTRCERRHYAK